MKGSSSTSRSRSNLAYRSGLLAGWLIVAATLAPAPSAPSTAAATGPELSFAATRAFGPDVSFGADPLYLPGGREPVLAAAAQAGDKIEPELRTRMEADPEGVPVFVLLRRQSGLDEASYRSEPGLDKEQWRQKVVDDLRAVAHDTQAALLGSLEAAGHAHETERSFWIVNGVNLKLDAGGIDWLSRSEDVARMWLRTEKPADLIVTEGKFTQAFEQPAGEIVTVEELLAHDELSWNLEAIQADLVWSRLGLIGRGAVIAILDSGVNYRHSDFRYHLWRNEGEIERNLVDDDGNGYVDDIYGFNFANGNGNIEDDFFHGNSSASVMVGDGRGGILTGVAPGAELMVLRMYDQRTRHNNSTLWQAFQYDAWEALQYAVAEGADVINMSFAWEPAELPVHAAWRYAATNVVAAGVVMVAGSGNFRGSYPIPGQIRPPASVPAVIATGGVLEDLSIPPLSSRGPVTWSEYPPFDDYPLPKGLTQVAFSAPWGNFPVVTFSGRGYEVLTGQAGSSLTSPHVAGVIALMLENDPELRPDQIRDILAASSLDVGEIGDDPYMGAGLVQAFDAITLGTLPLPRVTAVRYRPGAGAGGEVAALQPGTGVVVEIDLANPGAADRATRVSLGSRSAALEVADDTVVVDELGRAATVAFSTTLGTDAAPGSVLALELVVKTATGGARRFELELPVWGSSVLLVDDDGGGFYEAEWRASLERQGVGYDLLSFWPEPRAPLGGLERYGTVVWIKGEEAYEVLADHERRDLESFVAAGGRLVLVGQNLARDLRDTEFLRSLGVRFVDDIARPTRLAGGPQTSLDGFEAAFTAYPTLPDAIAPLAGARALLPLADSDGEAAVGVEADNTVVLTIEIAGIADTGQRDEMVCSLLHSGC